MMHALFIPQGHQCQRPKLYDDSNETWATGFGPFVENKSDVVFLIFEPQYVVYTSFPH